jgi:molecular chaperone DnaJ
MSTRDFVEKDYYKALGVPKDASQADIKKAYRKLARELHPDKNPGDAAAETRFKEVSEAYDVLSDESRRKEYDEARTLFAAGGRPGGGLGGFGGFGGGNGAGPGVPFDLNDLLGNAKGGVGGLFDSIFQRTGQSTRGPRRGADLSAEVSISFEDALKGIETTVRLPGAAACETCIGTGAAPGTAPRTCPTCQGLGVISTSQGGFALSEPCRDCRGKGQIIDNPCPVCRGTGRRERLQRIRVPAGVADGQRLRVRGRGGAGERGGPPGDLEVLVHVAPHQLFGRDGANLTLMLPVTFPEAALGAEVRIPTPDGAPVTVRIPAGTSNGRRLRVRGRGMPRSGGDRGDLLVTVEVAIPQKLDANARRALEEYAQHAGGDPRSHLTALLGQ